MIVEELPDVIDGDEDDFEQIQMCIRDSLRAMRYISVMTLRNIFRKNWIRFISVPD